MTVSKKVRKTVQELLPDKLRVETNVGPLKVGAEYDVQRRLRRQSLPKDSDLSGGIWAAEHPNARRRRTAVERMERLP